MNIKFTFFQAKLLLRHLNLLRTLKHENIVRLLGSYSRLEDKVKSVYASFSDSP